MLARILNALFRSLFGTTPQRILWNDPSLREPPPTPHKPKWPAPRSLDHLAKRLNIPIDKLRAHTPTYTTRTIPKKSGGTRTLHIPDPATKRIQRTLLRAVLNRANSHDAAMAYEPGRSIVTHAQRHANRAVIIGIDIQNFFPSTRARWVHEYFLAAGWDKEAADLLTRLTTHDNALPQGAPTSPKLSNLVNHLLDARLTGLARHYGGRYSRYADDIVLSLPTADTMLNKNLVNLATHVIEDCGYLPHMKKKLFIRRPHQRQQIAGLVVNNGPPRLPREVKRRLRAINHRIAMGKQPTLTPTQLAGWESFQRMVEGD